MIVHLGIVVIAVAFAASRSYSHQTQQTVGAGQTIAFAGHRVTYLGTVRVSHSNRVSQEARLRIDGGKVYRPAISEYSGGGAAIATPAVRSTPRDDVYLKLVDAPVKAGDPATIGIIVQPLIMWLWIGGGIVALGTLLAAWPGRRRRPVEPVSALAAGAGSDGGGGEGDAADGAGRGRRGDGRGLRGKGGGNGRGGAGDGPGKRSRPARPAEVPAGTP
jgi:cytochrome c-type biogenesis protein CcmF